MALGERGQLDVAFRVEPGITILFGPSGAGKSTTLAGIAGLVKLDRGVIKVRDEVWLDTEKAIDRPVHTRRLAMVFQSLALFPHLTAEDNVAYGLDRALSASARRARATELLGQMQVGHLIGRRPATFSGGEAQRVALARAFAREPQVLLLDEPFSAMDRKLRSELGVLVRVYVDRAKVPAILVTHHRQEARDLGDRVVMMERGRIVREGGIDVIE